MKKDKSLILILSIILTTTLISASMIIPSNERAKENSQATEHSPVISENWNLQKKDFIHYAKPIGSEKNVGSTACYLLLGMKWKAFSVSYVINPTNSGLPENFVKNAITASAETWDKETITELFDDNYSLDYAARYGVQDFRNSITFGDYPSNEVIAVTSIWYSQNQMVEFDIMFNTRYPWYDATLNQNFMDLQNIATHEFGHAIGLGDLYTKGCSKVTMFGYSEIGEIQKRTLEKQDIAGLQRVSIL